LEINLEDFLVPISNLDDRCATAGDSWYKRLPGHMPDAVFKFGDEWTVLQNQIPILVWILRF